MDQETENKILTTVIKFISSFFSKEGPHAQIEIPIDPPKQEEQPKQEVKPVAPTAQKFVLTHTRFCPDGIFGKLERDDGTFICYTLEHSYDNKPKLADGTYTCVRGPHKLHGMTNPFMTFEIIGIPDFNGVSVTGVLFHWGNYGNFNPKTGRPDSDGCVLMGSSETPTMICNSVQTWSAFMSSMDGVDSFELTVKST